MLEAIFFRRMEYSIFRFQPHIVQETFIIYIPSQNPHTYNVPNVWMCVCVFLLIPFTNIMYMMYRSIDEKQAKAIIVTKTRPKTFPMVYKFCSVLLISFVCSLRMLLLYFRFLQLSSSLRCHCVLVFLLLFCWYSLACLSFCPFIVSF